MMMIVMMIIIFRLRKYWHNPQQWDGKWDYPVREIKNLGEILTADGNENRALEERPRKMEMDFNLYHGI